MLEPCKDNQTTLKFLKHFHIHKKKPDINFLAELAKAMGNFPFENITKILKKFRYDTNETRTHFKTPGPTGPRRVAEGGGPPPRAEVLSTVGEDEDRTRHSDRAGFEMGAKAFRLPDELFEDYLRYGTGGTCFSLTFFFYEILKECGFICYPVMADRSYGENTHCALIALLDSKKYLIDPGFLINRPIPLPLTGDLNIPMEFNSIYMTWNNAPNVLDIYTIHLDSKKLRYRLKVDPVSWEDFQKYWIESFNWSGMNNVVVTTTINGQQIYLRNRHLRIVKKEGITRKTISLDEIQSVKTLLKIDPKLTKNAFDVLAKK